MIDGTALTDVQVPSWVAALMFVVGSLGNALVTIIRASRGEKTADFRRLEMEMRLGTKMEGIIHDHEERDDDTYVRKDIYNSDLKHEHALGVILERIDELHERSERPR